MTDPLDDTGLLIGPTASLTEAMKHIDKNERGIVFVVDDDRRLLGSATDGDIRRSIIDGGELSAPVKEVLNPDPIVVRESETAAEVENRLSHGQLQGKLGENQVLTVPVVDDGIVVDVTTVSREGRVQGDRSTANRSVNTVLVIGGGGYIGSVLCEHLLERGYGVRVLDTLLYGSHGIEESRNHDRFTVIQGDMRSIEDVLEATRGADAVVHLGALVGDPASSLAPQKTLEINLHAVKLAAEICKYHQINRFLFASTCSVYGQSAAPDALLDEHAETNPVSLYAKTKLMSERALLERDDENFSPTILRMATVYGLSPRMRFDLVVNVLTAKAHDEGRIPIFGGDQYRPNVHVADAARAYITCIEASIDDVASEVFNVGSNAQNYAIREVGELVAAEFPNAEIALEEGEDDRSYSVDFSKIHDRLDYEVAHTIPDGVREIRAALEANRIEDYTAERYSNIRSLEGDRNPLEST